MPAGDFYSKPFDAGTLAKLRVFELYAQEWIPVFLSRADPPFPEVHIFDFFAGPGKDSVGASGSPLRILGQLQDYWKQGLAGWPKVQVVAHFFDSDTNKIAQLDSVIREVGWNVPGVQLDLQAIEFKDALEVYSGTLIDPSAAKLLIIDQCGVDEVSDDIFKRLIHLPTTDFIFFLSSSTLHRFRDHPAIKQKIPRPEDSYDVHRAVFDYYRRLIPSGEQVFLGRFSIRKERGNIYGLIFGSHHPLGIHKFLQVAWKNDEIAGEANFDIERENIDPGELLLSLPEMRPTKIREFEDELEASLRNGNLRSELDIIGFCIEAGMTCQHSTPVLKRLKSDHVIGCDFGVPDLKRLKHPRPIRVL
jgi:three-Cys-motif partner protein